MDEQTTGGSTSGGGTQTITSNTNLQEARSRYYSLPYDKSGAECPETTRKEDSRRSRESYSPTQIASDRQNIRQWSKVAQNALGRLEEACNNQDFMEATNAGVDFSESLGELWRLRKCREAEFAEIINMLQLSLAKIKFEALEFVQCKKLTELFNVCIMSGATDETEVRMARSMLKEAGFNPWRGLSLRED